jgi:NAD(P)-dependent dehydrogenase (short-subunit alcohol dehydrogenase family)
MTTNERPVALVTGASRGIGKACAIHLARAGYDVAVAARTLTEGEGRSDQDPGVAIPGGLDTTVAGIEAEGGAGLAVRMDLMDRQTLTDGVAEVLDRFGRIDLLLNNAIYQGRGAMESFLDLQDDDLQRLFEGNVFAQLALLRDVLPGMLERGSGTVMNMISATAHVTPPAPVGKGGWGVAYAMSKAALERVANVLQVEYQEHGLRFFSIDPGRVITEAAEARGAGKEFDRFFQGATPEIIGAAIAWLATSPEADDLLGQIVFAQRECKRRNLVPGWPPPRPEA